MADYWFAFPIKNLSNVIKKRIDWLSKDTELTGFQRYLMGYLIEEKAGEDVFQKDVEKHLRISRASVTSVLQLLEKNGFIERVSVPQDARLKKIVVTDKGRAAHSQNTAILFQVEEELVKGIDEQELKTFQCVLEKMRSNMDELNASYRGKEAAVNFEEKE